MNENEPQNTENQDLEVDDWEKGKREAVLKELQDSSPEAIETLRHVMRNGNPREARQAAETILSRTGFPEERKVDTPLVQRNTQINMMLQNTANRAIPAIGKLLGMDRGEIQELQKLAMRGLKSEEQEAGVEGDES